MSVKDLPRSIDFFTKLGFTFNPKFTNDESACLIISTNIFAMLSVESKFGKFIDKPIADPGTTEMMISLSCESPEQVRKLSEAAFANGARRVNDPEDHGFMFSWGFEDLDGHLWDLFWMNPANQ
jgi:predicted lactoylglutathione lyase